MVKLGDLIYNYCSLKRTEIKEKRKIETVQENFT